MMQGGSAGAAERAERREVVGKLRADELEQMLGVRHVLEAVPAQRAKRRRWKGLEAGDVTGRPRDDDLISVPCRADARGHHDVHADVALVTQLRLTGVDPGPDA